MTTRNKSTLGMPDMPEWLVDALNDPQAKVITIWRGEDDPLFPEMKESGLPTIKVTLKKRKQ